MVAKGTPKHLAKTQMTAKKNTPAKAQAAAKKKGKK